MIFLTIGTLAESGERGVLEVSKHCITAHLHNKLNRQRFSRFSDVLFASRDLLSKCILTHCTLVDTSTDNCRTSPFFHFRVVKSILSLFFIFEG